MLLAWGPFEFISNAAAYEELVAKTGKRLIPHEIIGRAPANQYLGPKRDEIMIKGTVFPMDQPGAAEMAIAMGQEAKANTSYLLVSGRGDVFGQFTLEDFERREGEIIVDGIAAKVSYDLKLVEDPDAAGPIWSAWP